MKKNIPLAIGIILAIVGAGGCKKCYECSTLRADFTCHNSSDTVGFWVVTGKRANDSLNYYRSRGYTCDTIQFFYTIGDVYSNPVCSNNEYNYAMSNDDKCEPIK